MDHYLIKTPNEIKRGLSVRMSPLGLAVKMNPHMKQIVLCTDIRIMPCRMNVIYYDIILRNIIMFEPSAGSWRSIMQAYNVFACAGSPLAPVSVWLSVPPSSCSPVSPCLSPRSCLCMALCPTLLLLPCLSLSLSALCLWPPLPSPSVSVSPLTSLSLSPL